MGFVVVAIMEEGKKWCGCGEDFLVPGPRVTPVRRERVGDDRERRGQSCVLCISYVFDLVVLVQLSRYDLMLFSVDIPVCADRPSQNGNR